MSYLQVGKNLSLLLLLVVVIVVIVVLFRLLIDGDYYCVGLLFDTVYLLSEWGLLLVVLF